MSRPTTTPSGLSQEEAQRRLETYGPNKIRASKRVSAIGLFLGQFKNIFVVILLIATGASFFMGHGVEAIAITVIVLFSVVFGFIQEFRAETALQALQKLAAPNATVVRNGAEKEIPAEEVVPGDVLVLLAGDIIPADAILLNAENLRVQESALTGESMPVQKMAAADVEAEAFKSENSVFAGTAISIGRGHALVHSTGMKTEFGKIAQLLSEVEEPLTPLQVGLNSLAKKLAFAAVAIVCLIVLLGITRGEELFSILLFGIALAVAVVPEALPAVVTISLSLGVQRLLKKNALVRKLSAVETLGSTSVICTDKTGTLTKDEMTLRTIVAGGMRVDVTGSGYNTSGEFLIDGQVVQPSPQIVDLLVAATLANDASTIKGDPTEIALVVATEKAGIIKSELEERSPRVFEIPFSSDLRRMHTVHLNPNNVSICVKGAPEVIFDICSHEMVNNASVQFTDERRSLSQSDAHELASKSMRVLAVASRNVSDFEVAKLDQAEPEKHPFFNENYTLLGLVGLIDPPRPEVYDALQTCANAGIRVIMATGDHPDTARAIASELGVFSTKEVITGSQLEAMSDEELDKAVSNVDVFARVAPAHKLRIVEALQSDGAIVAMTGDGVNDAPALRKADIGIAMGIKGTDVARETAAMTLVDDNFASIVDAVEEGRRIYSNIKKFLMFLLSSNIGEIGVMAIATIAGLPLPLTAVQLLYINLATDGLPALSLAVDPIEPNAMKRRPRDSRRGMFTKPVVALMLTGGVWSSLINIGVFVWALNSGRAYEESVTMTFVSLILVQFFKAYAFRSDTTSTFVKPFANKWLNIAVIWELTMLCAVVYVPALHVPFGTYSLSMVDWLIILIASASVLPVMEVAKKAVGSRQ